MMLGFVLRDQNIDDYEKGESIKTDTFTLDDLRLHIMISPKVNSLVL